MQVVRTTDEQSDTLRSAPRSNVGPVLAAATVLFGKSDQVKLDEREGRVVGAEEVGERGRDALVVGVEAKNLQGGRKGRRRDALHVSIEREVDVEHLDRHLANKVEPDGGKALELGE